MFDLVRSLSLCKLDIVILVWVCHASHDVALIIHYYNLNNLSIKEFEITELTFEGSSVGKF